MCCTYFYCVGFVYVKLKLDLFQFLKTYVEDYVVPRGDITLMTTTAKDSMGMRPNTIQACVRFPKTVVVHDKEIDVISALGWLVTETELQVYNLSLIHI